MVLLVSKAMFFVVSGAVEEVQEKDEGETVTAVRRTNHSVGGLAFFFGLRQLETARASKGGAVCLRLERESFVELLKTHQRDEDVIAQNAMRSFEVVNKSRMGGSSKHSGYSGMSSQSSGSSRKRKRKERFNEETASKKSGGSTSKKSSNSKMSEEKSTTVSTNLESDNSVSLLPVFSPVVLPAPLLESAECDDGDGGDEFFFLSLVLVSALTLLRMIPRSSWLEKAPTTK